MSEIKQSNLTIPAHGYVKLSRKFQGYQLHSYVRVFEVNLTMISNITEVELHLQGLEYNASFRLNTTQCDPQQADRYCVILHEGYTQEYLTANQMQSILADVKEATLNVRGSMGNGTDISVAMETAIDGDYGNPAGHVETCECPGHYKDLSCQNCNTGNRRLFYRIMFIVTMPISMKNTIGNPVENVLDLLEEQFEDDIEENLI